MTRKQILTALTTALHQDLDGCHDTIAHLVDDLVAESDAITQQRDDDADLAAAPVPDGVDLRPVGGRPGRVTVPLSDCQAFADEARAALTDRLQGGAA